MQYREERVLTGLRRLSIKAIVGMFLLTSCFSLSAEEDASGPAYSLAADAAAGFTLASDGFDMSSPNSAAVWSLSANFLHRIEAPHWGLVFSHALDVTGQAATLSSIPAFSPTLTVYEAYARLDVSDWGQFFLGKRRMGLGIGTTFAPGDLIDPRTGFWDQKDGFSGVDAALSLGPDVSLRAALSLDRNFRAYAAGLSVKSADATVAASPTDAAAVAAASQVHAVYAAALGGASGPADPRLFVWALSADAQLGTLQIAAAGVYSPDYCERPSLGMSIDLGGLILQAEAAVDFEGAPDFYGTAGLRYTWSGSASSLTLSVDYDYNGAAGSILQQTHYLLPYINYTRDDLFSVYARALVELEEPSALLSTGITLYPVQGFDIELTGLFGLGESDSEFAQLAPIPSPAATPLSNAVGLAARVHF